jgi:hypothetical protein
MFVRLEEKRWTFIWLSMKSEFLFSTCSIKMYVPAFRITSLLGKNYFRLSKQNELLNIF